MAAAHRSVSVAAIIIDDQGRALLIRRRDNGHWEPPGGVLELGEHIHDGLRREVLEETGLQITPGKLTGTYNNIPRGIVSLVFRCQATGGEIGVSDESTAFRWIRPDEVADLATEAYAVRVLDAYRHDGPHVREHDGVHLL